MSATEAMYPPRPDDLRIDEDSTLDFLGHLKYVGAQLLVSSDIASAVGVIMDL